MEENQNLLKNEKMERNFKNWRASMGRNVGAEHAPIYL
jgi:hypothetical protein